MYAVLTTGGKQYRVEAGSTLVVEKLAGEPGSSITFDRVLLIGDGESVTVGTPTVSGASVRATVLGEELGEKIVVFKFKQKVKYRRRTGHRQHLTRVRIDSISADGKTVSAEVPEKTPKAARAKAAGPAQAEAKPARRSRARAGTPAEKAEEPSETAEPSTPAEKKPRARARSTSASTSASKKAAAEKAAEPAKPKARRPRSKAAPAKEE